MSHTRFTTRLQEMVNEIANGHSGRTRPLTVDDLRLRIRAERITEISGWSNRDLDAIELHAAQYDGHAPLDCVLRFDVPGTLSVPAASVSSICAPSPFAYT
jgi:hypothetical protein